MEVAERVSYRFPSFAHFCTNFTVLHKNAHFLHKNAPKSQLKTCFLHDFCARKHFSLTVRAFSSV